MRDHHGTCNSPLATTPQSGPNDTELVWDTIDSARSLSRALSPSQYRLPPGKD